MPGYGSEAPTRFDQEQWEDRILEHCSRPACVVAHSFSGPVAMAAAVRRPDLVTALVLFEPAAYALARGVPEVEDHIRRMTSVLDRADQLDAGAFCLSSAPP